MSNSPGAEVLISADSHVMEPHDLWTNSLAARFGDRAPAFKPLKVGEGFQHHPGGNDPRERMKEMAQDGVSAEVLYPTRGLDLFGQDDPVLQRASFQVYNDWLIEYCQESPERLVGVAAISAYDISLAIKELERCKKAGLKGAIIWEVPHPDMPFRSPDYEPLWAALEELELPLSLHILTGHSYFKKGLTGLSGVEGYRGSVNLKLADATNALFDFVWYGLLHRHPGLKLVLVEHEIGWLPFVVQQWDYYYRRFSDRNPPPINRPPGAYVQDQVFATFFNDAVGSKLLDGWGDDTCMWSNDFPHENSTWPNSRAVIERDLGRLPAESRRKIVCDTAAGLYGLQVPELV